MEFRRAGRACAECSRATAFQVLLASFGFRPQNLQGSDFSGQNQLRGRRTCRRPRLKRGKTSALPRSPLNFNSKKRPEPCGSGRKSVSKQSPTTAQSVFPQRIAPPSGAICPDSPNHPNNISFGRALRALRPLTKPANAKMPTDLKISVGIFAYCVSCGCKLRSLTSM